VLAAHHSLLLNPIRNRWWREKIITI